MIHSLKAWRPHPKIGDREVGKKNARLVHHWEGMDVVLPKLVKAMQGGDLRPDSHRSLLAKPDVTHRHLETSVSPALLNLVAAVIGSKLTLAVRESMKWTWAARKWTTCD